MRAETFSIRSCHGSKSTVEKAAQGIFTACGFFAVLAVASITLYMLISGTPALFKVGILEILFGTIWQPAAASPSFGILYVILTSIAGTFLAILIGVPIGVMTAIFLAEVAPKRVADIVRPAVELLAGIPSVVYGFFGLVVLVPWIREMGRGLGFGGNGSSILTASLLLGMMILPTIIGVTESAIRAVPAQYYEGAVALGATHERAIFRVILPAAKSGVVAGIVLGIGRAIGETMAVIMVAGNQARMPAGIFRGIRTLTANIVIEMGYATDLHREALIATGVVLFVFILLINFSVALLNRRGSHE